MKLKKTLLLAPLLFIPLFLTSCSQAQVVDVEPLPEPTQQELAIQNLRKTIHEASPKAIPEDFNLEYKTKEQLINYKPSYLVYYLKISYGRYFFWLEMNEKN